MASKQQKPGVVLSARLSELLSKQCSTQIKCQLLEGFREQLRDYLKLLRQKIENNPQCLASTATTEPQVSPQCEQSTLWESIDELETSIIENKEVVLHFKSIVECYDEELDDLEKVLEVKSQVSKGLTTKIIEARGKLRDKVLAKSAGAKAKPSKIIKDMSKSVSTIHSEDTYTSEKSQRRSSLTSSFFNLWR